jgi:cytochrome c biogenesis protein CcmG, thiol:disulfide interchange protein DsbE
MRALRFIIPALLFAVLIGFFFAGLKKDPSLVPSPLIDRPAPPLRLPELGRPGAVFDNAALAGKPYLVNVWATWCGACREEHATLMAIAAQSEVTVVGLDWKDEEAAAQRWLAALGNPYDHVGFDGDGRVAIDWGVYGAPETFLVGADGKVKVKRIGAMTADIWQTEFLPLLGGAK